MLNLCNLVLPMVDVAVIHNFDSHTRGCVIETPLTIRNLQLELLVELGQIEETFLLKNLFTDSKSVDFQEK